MRHLDEGTIHAWLDGALSPDEAARAEAHVASCTTCGDAVAEARGLIAASSRILTALDNVPSVRGARGAEGAEGAKWGRRSIATWLVRERIAAVVALVVAGGALTMMLSRASQETTAGLTVVDSAQPVELAAADSPAPPPAVAVTIPEARKAGQATGVEGDRAANVARSRTRDLAAARRPDSAPLAVLDSATYVVQADVANAEALQTDDTLRPVAAAEVRPEQAELRTEREALSRLEERLRRVPGRGAAAEAPTRLAEPLAPQPSRWGVAVGAASGAGAPVLVQEERMTESGREIRRRIYRVEDVLVTLDERAPDTYEKRRAAREDAYVAPPVPPAARQDSTLSSNTIQWTDAKGVDFTLTGTASKDRLEQIKKLLGY